MQEERLHVFRRRVIVPLVIVAESRNAMSGDSLHCVKIVRIWSFSGRIKSECGEIRTRIRTLFLQCSPYGHRVFRCVTSIFQCNIKFKNF